MKNHIKNYIKIMGLVAVPLGTAQVHGKPTEYRIEVKRVNEEYRFKVTVAYSFKMEVVEKSDEMKIVWVRGLPRLFLSTKEHVIKESSVSIRKMSFNSFEDATMYVPSFYIASANHGNAFFCQLVLIPEKFDDKDFEDAILLVMPGGEQTKDDVVDIISDVPVGFAGISRPTIDNLVRITRASPFVKRWFREAEKMGFYVAKFDACEEEEDEESEGSDRNKIESENEEAKKEEDDGEESGSRKSFEIKEKPKENPIPTQARIKALFEADRARREKDPELEKERMWREKATINARNRIREFIRIDPESRKIKEDNKIGKNEIIVEDQKCEDKKEEKLFERNAKEDYFKGFDAFKENLSAEFKKNLEKSKSGKNEIKIEGKKSKEPEIFKSEDCFEFPENRFEFSEVVNPNPMKIEDKKEDVKIDQSEITFGNKSLAESICNKSSDRENLSKFAFDSDDE